MNNLDKLRYNVLTKIKASQDEKKNISNLSRKNLLEFQNYANKFTGINEISNDDKKKLKDNYSSALLFNFWLIKLGKSSRIHGEDLEKLTSTYLNFKNNMGKNIILKALISFQNKKNKNDFDLQFDEFLKKYKFDVLGKIRNENFKDILFEYEGNGKYTEKKLKNSNININIKIQPIKQEPIKITENQSNQEFKKLLELNLETTGINRNVRKLYCQKKLPEEGKKVKNGIFKQNTKDYISCKNERKITIKEVINEGISPTENLSSSNINSILRECKYKKNGKLNNICTARILKNKLSA